MKRIILHWTVGTNQPNDCEYESYHYLVNGDGLVIKGKFTPEDNKNCKDGKYAKHCGGGNTGSIGIAVCGMMGYINKNHVGGYPITKVQCERLFKLIAEVAKEYKIPITPNTIMTHYEFGLQHPTTTSKGKIDLTYLPPYPHVTQGEVGGFIRNKVTWYYKRI